MDELFVANIPDLAQWGELKSYLQDEPRPHLCTTLEVTVDQSSPQYDRIVQEMAVSIASARLPRHYLDIWKNKVSSQRELSPEDRLLIARALARGICHLNNSSQHETPTCTEEHFKGHIVEVLLYCLRVYVRNNGNDKPCIFQPPFPKATPTTGGIDLLEIGETEGEFYFHIWECKGTDGSVISAFRIAAKHLCDPESTSYQSFMETYRCLIENDLLRTNDSLNDYVVDMPRKFYSPSPDSSKRLGATIGTGSNYTLSCTHSFSEKIGDSVGSGHINCQTVIIKIIDFPQFRQDVFQYLWNI